MQNSTALELIPTSTGQYEWACLGIGVKKKKVGLQAERKQNKKEKKTVAHTCIQGRGTRRSVQNSTASGADSNMDGTISVPLLRCKKICGAGGLGWGTQGECRTEQLPETTV